jgi:signal transduction histidine kinase
VTGVLGSDSTGLLRYEPDGDVTVLATWASPELTGEQVVARVLATGRPASTDGDDGRRTLGAPIFVAGRLWGAMITTWAPERVRPEGVEARMAEFTELVATAVANAESRAELAASRARVVAAADEARRRIERDLHDGTQQRLVTLGLRLRASEALAPPEGTELRAELASAVESLTSAVEELQEISRGIHPAILSRGGLGPALRSLARRSSVPVDLELDVDRRLPEQVEVATYYVVSEALTNAAKHSRASTLRVRAGADNGVVSLSITDDGVGGADPEGGSGLVGLRDRVEALGGELRVSSVPGQGTALDATIPIPPGE